MSKPLRPSNREFGRYAAGLFAATVTLTTGGGVCLIVAAVAAPDLLWPATLIGCGTVGMIFLLWRIVDGPMRRADRASLYVAQQDRLRECVASFRPQLRRRERRPAGSNRPPTADDLRKIKEDSNCWCPSERRAEEYRRSLGKSH